MLVALTGRPLAGLLLYVFSFYAYAPGSWWGQGIPDLRWSFLAAITTLIAIYIQKIKHSKQNSHEIPQENFLKSTEAKLFLIFVVWVWIQNGWALSATIHHEYSIMATKFLLLLYLMRKSLTDEKSIIIFIIANMAGCAYFGWIGLTQHQGGRFEYVPTPGLNDGNLLSLHMAPMLLIGCFLLICNLNKKKYLLIIPIVLIVNAIFLTQSRGAIAGLVVGALLVLMFRPKKLRKQFSAYVFLALIAVIQLVPEDLLGRLSQATESRDLRDKSAESRLVIIEAQYNIFKNAPILGHGHRGTLLLSPQYIPDTYLTGDEGNRARGSHNILMSLLVDFGIVGTVLYLSIVYLFLKRLFAMRKSIINLEAGNLSILYMAGVAALMTLMASSMFSNSLRLEIDIFIFGILSSAYYIMQKKKTSDETLPDLVK